MDSEENMAKLVLLYVMLSIYAADIVYLWRLQKSLKFAILECKKSKICDFLNLITSHFFPSIIDKITNFQRENRKF